MPVPLGGAFGSGGHAMPPAVTQTLTFTGTGVLTRGVLLDLAPGGALEADHHVGAADLDEAEQRCGVRVESGDALVVRGGWTLSPETAASMPILTLDAVRWLADHEVCLYVGDIGDKPPIVPGGSTVVHRIALGRLGMPLVDRPELDELSRTCRELGRYSFLFVLGTIPVTGATGLPVTPLAIF